MNNGQGRTGTYTKLGVFVLLVMILFALVGSAQAVEFIGGEVIAEDEVIDDDVFISGQNVVVNGRINGNLFAAGSTVTLNGVVDGSVFTGAQNVRINGEITGSLFAGASAVDVGASAEVGRNLFFGGFSITTEKGSHIGRDLLAGAYQALLSGNIDRDVRAGLAALEIYGRVGGDVSADVGSPGEGAFPSFWGPPGAPPMVSPGVRISPNADIQGELDYTSTVQQEGAIEAEPAGGVVFSTPEPGQADREAERRPRFDLGVFGWIIDRLRDLVTLLILGGLGLWLLPEVFQQVAQKARSQPLPATGWGFVTVILGYLAAGLIAVLVVALGIFFGLITLGGLAGTVFGVGLSGLGVVFAVFTLLVNYGSKAVIAFLGGTWLLEKLAPGSAESRFLSLVLGVLIYVILRSIPFLGWLLAVFVTLIGMGAIWLMLRERPPLAPASES
jgi:cytoskeletal protein CcmA (bactofilin family)